jgi:hypothetical protein
MPLISLFALHFLASPLPAQGVDSDGDGLDDVTGGLLQFDFDFDSKYAGYPYIIIGSVAGNDITFLGSVKIPLIYDSITRMTLNRNYPTINSWSRFYGYLDSGGDGQALLYVHPADLTAYIGSTFYWAAFPMDTTKRIPTTSSNDVYFDVTQ